MNGLREQGSPTPGWPLDWAALGGRILEAAAMAGAIHMAEVAGMAEEPSSEAGRSHRERAADVRLVRTV